MRNSYLRRLALFVLVMVGCVRLPHVEPAPRSEVAQYLTSVKVEVDCDGSSAMFWSEGRSGTGVIISERHVLTAQHVVACPAIPNVHVTFATSDGPKRLRMYVIKEDPDTDIAKLEIGSAENFHLNVPPPALWEGDGDLGGEGACAWPDRTICGIVTFENNTAIFGMNAEKGDSGAGVYLNGLNYSTGKYTTHAGLLFGLVIRKGDGYTRITRVSPVWLEGT